MYLDAVMREVAAAAIVGPDETFSQYFGHSHEYWMDEAEKELDEKKIPVTGARLKTIAKSLAKQFHSSNQENL